MVDLVAQKMPSENDVHVARSFLTKILRSSMRRNEPISRPHSWHSTKFNENQLEPTKTQSPPTPVWHNRYDASSSSADLTSSWEQTNLCRVSDQFSSLGSMDSLEHVPHSYPAGPLTPAKSNNSMEHLGGGGGGGGGGGKRDSAYSSFSTSSGTPDYTLSKSNTASTENVLFKVSQWDTGGKPMSNRNPQSEARLDDRLTYFQIPGCEGQHSEDQAGSRVSTSSRSSFGPVWHVPEKTKKTSSPSPPPPAPPTRSDSFAATKQHERVHSTGHFEEPHMKMAMDHRRSFNLSPNHDFDSLAQNAHSQASASKPHSVNIQHHGDKSTFYPQPWTTTAPKAFNNTQETQSNGSSQHGQNHRRNLSTSSAVTASEQNENSNCYFCVTPNQPSQPFLTKDRKMSTSSERMCLSPQTVTKTRYSLPPPQHATQAKAMEERGTPNAETPYTSHPVSRISEQRRSMPVQTPHTDVKHEAYNSKICPKATPILHSLSMDANTNLDDGGDGKNMQRNERFATTLRNEILMRRAKLQKSKSAATLPATETELEEDQDVWKSSENATPTSNAYKDHLKEMQARVLKATSFRRRDLEPVLLESSELSTNYTSVARKESSLPPVSESVRSKSGPVARIGGRKRFPTEKKVKSFSEPDQIHHVGMKEDPSLAATSGAAKQSQTDVRPQSLAVSREAVPPPTRFPEEEMQGGLSVPESQRLGTFAEYEERWSTQKKPAVEKRASGRYRSADNILDHGTEERHQSSSGFHERSRSSPSADVFAQRFPAPPRKSESEYSQTGDRVPAEQPAAATGRSEPEREPPTATSHSLQEPRGDPKTSSASTDHTLANCSDSSGLPPLPPLPAPLPTAEQCEGTVDKGSEQLRASSHTEIGRNNMETRRSPSPQFSPQRLSDKPPASLPEDPSSSRFESMTEAQNPAVKKVPIRIIHSEAAAEKNCPFLRHPDPVPTETMTRVPSLTAGGQDSVFCAFTRQKDLYISTITDQNLKNHRDFTSGDQNHHRDSTSEDQNLHRDSTSEDQSLHRDSTSEDQNLHRDSTSEDQNLHKDSTSEDQKRAELVRDIMGKDRSLVEILDQSRMRTTMDLMEGIFPQGEQLGEGPRRRGSVKQARPTETRKESPAAISMVTSATYYSTSAPKAEMLMKMKDMPEDEEDSEEELDLDLANKKQELIDSLTKKLQVLREARESLQEDVLDNNALGEEVEEQVQARCKPNELEKFRMFVGDLDKVVSLLLSLSGRLARVENALNCPEEDATAEERRTLMEKRKLLIRQHEDAKELKENLDRRERVVCEILGSSLHQEALTDYEHFVKMKSALIIEQRKLDDKIKLGEEQLKCLLDSLPLDQRLL